MRPSLANLHCWCAAALAFFTLSGAFHITTTSEDVVDKIFDYIVVGGGTAGLVMARRLAESATSRSVLVIEAGFDTRTNENISTVDSLYGRWAQTTNLSYIYESQPQPFKSKHEQIHHPMGRGLGGSSTINGVLWDGPQVEQIDAWRELFEEDSSPSMWGWKELLPAFNKSQHVNPPRGRAMLYGATSDTAQHNTAGPVDVSFLGSAFAPAFSAVREAIKEVFGFPQALDAALGKDLNGFQYNANYIKPDAGSSSDDANATSSFIRVSSATAYLDMPEAVLPNLTILTNWSAVQLVTKKESSGVITATAVAIKQEMGGSRYTIKTQGEIVLSAGAIKSPVLLELSGIGDPAVHKKIGVSTVLNLPGVGRNLMEHPSITIAAPLHANETSNEQFGPSPAHAMLPVASVFSNVSQVQAYFASSTVQWAQRSVDLGGAVDRQGMQKQYQLIGQGIFQQSWPVVEHQYSAHKMDHDLSFSVVLLNPLTRGSVHALSDDAIWLTQQVNVSTIFYAQPFDVEMHVASARASRRLLQASALTDHVLSGNETSPGFDKVPRVDDAALASPQGQLQYAAWADFITTTASPFNHLMGTCAMMSRSLGGVVDPAFRVYGTSNLRVVDASVIPMQISAHTSGTLYGIAELASEKIAQGAA